jgi:hypothetical protein
VYSIESAFREVRRGPQFSFTRLLLKGSSLMKPIRLLALSLVTTLTASAQNTYPFPSSGNVGIGTTAPWTPLQIVGPFTPGGTQLMVQSSGSDDRQGIAFYNAAGNRTGIIYNGLEDGFIFGREQAGMLRFFSGGAERLSIGATGNVGVGTSSPDHRLHIVSSNVNGLLIETPNGGPWAFRLRNTSAPNRGLELFQDDSGTSQIWSNYNAGAGALIALHPSGNVGIGSSNPGERLTITAPTAGTSTALRLERGSGGAYWNMNLDGNGLGFAYSTQAAGQEKFIITSEGNVGIGMINPAHKLAVNGTIKAKEVIVETTGWSDYVFADDYALQPLAEVEAHIKANKHLPGIPSAVEVAEQGVSVGDMQARLLAKIEELTLHQIAQEKLLKAQASQLTAQADELSALRAVVAGPRK